MFFARLLLLTSCHVLQRTGRAREGSDFFFGILARTRPGKCQGTKEDFARKCGRIGGPSVSPLPIRHLSAGRKLGGNPVRGEGGLKAGPPGQHFLSMGGLPTPHRRPGGLRSPLLGPPPGWRRRRYPSRARSADSPAQGGCPGLRPPRRATPEFRGVLSGGWTDPGRAHPGPRAGGRTPRPVSRTPLALQVPSKVPSTTCCGPRPSSPCWPGGAFYFGGWAG